MKHETLFIQRQRQTFNFKWDQDGELHQDFFLCALASFSFSFATTPTPLLLYLNAVIIILVEVD